MEAQKKSGQTTDRRVDVYQMVTDRIVAALEAGTIPWKKTWKGLGYARNYVTKHTYMGINALLTNLSPYSVPYFITLKQANDLGGSVQKGSKSLPIVFWKIRYKDADGRYYSEAEANERSDLQKLFLARYYRVFNIEDVTGIEFNLPNLEHQHDFIPICEQMIDFMPKSPEIRIGGSEAYYAPPIDTVQMPTLAQFESPEAYYSTFFHELVHSTGHSSRLNRDEVMGKVRFGSLEYSQEELVAEIGSAFLCNQVGVETPSTFKNAAAYIHGWLSKLQDDKRFIFRAAKEAKQAAEYIVNV